jgi:hypothetical protein
MRIPNTDYNPAVESIDRRGVIKGALGAAAAAAAIPTLSGVAAAHFPAELAIDIKPGGETNAINPNSGGTVPVAVLNTMVTREGEQETFDPIEREQRYRFGAPSALKEGGGARPTGDGEVRDVNGDGKDDLVLQFPVAETGLTGGEAVGQLNWDRDDSREHGFSGQEVVMITGDTAVSDVEILNYALTLEHLEAAYYNDFLNEHTESEVENSEAIGRAFGKPKLQYSTYQEIEAIRDHEEAHVETLASTIEDLGGTPVEPAEYEFPYDSMETFVKLSQRIEAVGVSAYAGAAPLIDDPDLIPPALSIHSVEARHTSFFGSLVPGSSMPNAFDPARSMAQVVPIAQKFIVG